MSEANPPNELLIERFLLMYHLFACFVVVSFADTIVLILCLELSFVFVPTASNSIKIGNFFDLFNQFSFTDLIV